VTIDKVGFHRRCAGHLRGVLLLRPPGVYRADWDTALLAGLLGEPDRVRGRRVLDVGTGTGALALAAARGGAESVTAVDLSRRSAAVAWLNARLHRAPVEVRCGDLYEPVRGRRFDVVVANPPYVPAAGQDPARYTIARCWDAGEDGRLLLDRLIAGLPDVLTVDGRALILQSEVCGEEKTIAAMGEVGLEATVVARATIPFGPVMRARAALLEARGMIEPGQRVEEIVVVEGRR
jgi:release factor glutamine methyltransferase